MMEVAELTVKTTIWRLLLHNCVCRNSALEQKRHYDRQRISAWSLVGLWRVAYPCVKTRTHSILISCTLYTVRVRSGWREEDA